MAPPKWLDEAFWESGSESNRRVRRRLVEECADETGADDSCEGEIAKYEAYEESTKVLRGNLLYAGGIMFSVTCLHAVYLARQKHKGIPVRGLMRYPKLEKGLFILLSTGLFESCISILANPLAEIGYMVLSAGILASIITFNVWFFCGHYEKDDREETR